MVLPLTEPIVTVTVRPCSVALPETETLPLLALLTGLVAEVMVGLAGSVLSTYRRY